jgi:hypothetical protein
MSQSINLRAVQWAYAQERLTTTSKAVLMTFAIHADQRGYTWPGVDHIATKWGMDRKTVRRQIESLLVRRMIRRTNKKRGATGQVKVYRLPKITYERGGKYTPFENEQRVPKESHKSPISGGEFPPNNIIINKEERRISDQGTAKTYGNSIPNTSRNTSDSFSSGSHQYQNVPARDHRKWLEFAAWCHSKGGTPSEKGFWSWLCKQKPQWRNKIRQNPAGEEGYDLDGKFYPADEANRMAEKNSELALKFRKAIKRNGKIHPA